MSEQRKTTGTHKRAPKKDTESKTTRTRKKVAEEQAAPVQQNEEAAPDRVKAEEEQAARAPEQMAGKSEHDGAKPEQTPPAAGSFEVARVLKVAKPLMRRRCEGVANGFDRTELPLRHQRSRWDIRKVDRLRRAVLSSVKRLDCQRTRGQVHDRRAWWNMERVTEHREAPTLAA